MAIPSAPELMLPVLSVHEDGSELRLQDIVTHVGPAVDLSEEALAQRQPSGDLVFTQRVGWARNYLEQLGLLSRPTRGGTRITDAGREALALGEPIAPPPADWAAKPVSRDYVLRAIELFRSGDRDDVLHEHGFGRALDYVVEYEGETFDAKALYGIAYSIQYPDEEPIRNRGLQGGRVVNGKLEELGFEVKSLRRDNAPEDVSTGVRVWLVRAGRQGRYEELALDQDVSLIGWSELGDIDPEASRDDLKAAIVQSYGEASAASLASQAGQIYRFVNEVAIGDLVVLPLMTAPGHAGTGDDERLRQDPAV